MSDRDATIAERMREQDRERQRRCRDRKSRDVLLVSVEVDGDLLDVLNDAGVAAWNENDPVALGRALTKAIKKLVDVTRDRNPGAGVR